MATAEPWPAEEARQRRAMALREVGDAGDPHHGHGPLPRGRANREERELVRENCSACLHRYARARPSGAPPNVAGWARVWVQAGWAVPPAWLAVELARTDNPAYEAALRRDLATWPQEERRTVAVGQLADGCRLAVSFALRTDAAGPAGPELSLTYEERLPRPVRGEALQACGAGVPEVVGVLLAQAAEGYARLAWPPASLERLASIAAEWHLNHMRAGCVHQRALGWAPCHGYHKPGLTCKEEPRPGAASTEAVAEAMQRVAKEGVAAVGGPGGRRCALDAVGKPCPTCGYRYGSAWLAEPLPADVLAWVRAVIATGEPPAQGGVA